MENKRKKARSNNFNRSISKSYLLLITRIERRGLGRRKRKGKFRCFKKGNNKKKVKELCLRKKK